MLSRIDRLIDPKRCFLFDDEGIEILSQQHLDCFRKRPDNPGFHVFEGVENGQCPILKDWVRI